MPSCCCGASSSANRRQQRVVVEQLVLRAPAAALEQPQRLVARNLAHPRHAVVAVAGAAPAPRAHERLLHDFVDVVRRRRGSAAPRGSPTARIRFQFQSSPARMRAVPLASSSHLRSIAEVA